jgi:hypothetical protein
VSDERARAALFVALAAGAIGFCLAFVAPSFYPLAVLWYHPLEHRFALEVKADGLAMDFFGRVLWGTLASLIAFAVAFAIGRRLRAISASALILWTAWLATAALLAMSLFVYQLARRHPTPLPLPSWYEPR